MGYDIEGIHTSTGDMMGQQIVCDYCGNEFTVRHPASEVWRCSVCGNDVYDEVEEEDGWHYEDEGRESGEGDDERRLREY